MSPCGIGAMTVCQLTSLKFWQIHHFCGPSGYSVVVHSCTSCSGSVKAGGIQFNWHCLLTQCWSSSDKRLLCSWAFCASTMVATHFTWSGGACSMISAVSISSTLLWRNCNCRGVSALWWTHKWKVTPSGILSGCLAPGTGSTSPNNPAKTSTKDVMSFSVHTYCSSIKSLLYWTFLTIKAIQFTLKGSVSLVKIVSSFSRKPISISFSNASTDSSLIAPSSVSMQIDILAPIIIMGSVLVSSVLIIYFGSGSLPFYLQPPTHLTTLQPAR